MGLPHTHRHAAPLRLSRYSRTDRLSIQGKWLPPILFCTWPVGETLAEWTPAPARYILKLGGFAIMLAMLWPYCRWLSAVLQQAGQRDTQITAVKENLARAFKAADMPVPDGLGDDPGKVVLFVVPTPAIDESCDKARGIGSLSGTLPSLARAHALEQGDHA